jgi:hypothetical protein
VNRPNIKLIGKQALAIAHKGCNIEFNGGSEIFSVSVPLTCPTQVLQVAETQMTGIMF